LTATVAEVALTPVNDHMAQPVQSAGEPPSDWYLVTTDDALPDPREMLLIVAAAWFVVNIAVTTTTRFVPFDPKEVPAKFTVGPPPVSAAGLAGLSNVMVGWNGFISRCDSFLADSHPRDGLVSEYDSAV
jgi:hypothetical protein